MPEQRDGGAGSTVARGSIQQGGEEGEARQDEVKGGLEGEGREGGKQVDEEVICSRSTQ